MSIENKGEVRTRFAPSPTGIPHVGNIRTALFDKFFATANNGTFILRIEDTDQARKMEGAVESIKDSLTWLGAEWDEYAVQSEHIGEYKQIADELVKNGHAVEENGAVRFIVSHEGPPITWIDTVGNRTVTFQRNEIENFIILKKDGFPTYHLANVIDDHTMEISHVIRGEDWVSSTPKHILIYEALGWVPPIFAHVPNVLGVDGKKLSKRHGAKSVLEYKDEGILPQALLNYLMLLGWSPKNDREIISKDKISQEFNLDKVNVGPATFDARKLLWMNGEYIRMTGIKDLQNALLSFDPTVREIPDFEKYIPLAQTRMKTLADFKDMVVNNTNYKYSDSEKKTAVEFAKVLLAVSDWNKDTISKAIFEFRDIQKLSMKNMYTLLTGKPQGLPIAEKLEIEGKDVTIHRLSAL